MPFYSFKCPKCQTQRDELVKYGVESTACRDCGEPTVKLPSFKSVAVGLPNGFAATRSTIRKGDGK